MKYLLLLFVAMVAVAVADVNGDASSSSRRLSGGYSESFCERSLRDCCVEKGTEPPSGDEPYPNCRCPKRQKGGAEEPYLFFGSYGGDDGICANCATKYPSLPVGPQ